MVTIEDLVPQHFPVAAGWLSKTAINRWLTAEWRNRQVDAGVVAIAVRNRKNRLFLVRSDDTPCGLVGLADIDPVDHTAMVWYLLGEDAFAGRGITSDAVRQVGHLAFASLQITSIYAWIMEDNVSSRRVLEKCNFRECGRLRKAADSSGRQVDRVYFDITAQDIVEIQEK